MRSARFTLIKIAIFAFFLTPFFALAAPLYQPGEKLQVIDGPFAGLEAIYHMDDGLARGIVLIELLNRSTKLNVSLGALRKSG